MRAIFPTVATLGLLLAATPAAADDDVLGTWLSEDGTLAIEIAPCDTGLCGTVAWAEDDADLVGSQVLVEVPAIATDNGEHRGGVFEDPSTRKTLYRLRIRVDDGGRLELRGVAGVERRGRVVTSRFATKHRWTRVDLADLGR